MQCDVVSVKESLYSGTVTMLIAKGAGGELGIMPGHAPLVTLLKPGAIRVLLENGTEELIYVSGGVLEVQPHVVTVLADTAVRADNLDEAAILEARKNAEQLLANQKSDLDAAAALAALAETAAQLETIRKIKNRAVSTVIVEPGEAGRGHTVISLTIRVNP
jgi:F-type H+-transporting ATPase subunit epsilon